MAPPCFHAVGQSGLRCDGGGGGEKETQYNNC